MSSFDKPVPKTRTNALLREAWRRAYRLSLEGQQLEITLKTESQAHKARMDLYAAVRPEKQGGGESLEMREAAQTVEIVLKPGARNVLIMRSRSQNDIYSALEEAVGMKLAEATDLDEAAEAQRSLDRLMGITSPQPESDPTAPAPAEHQENPFYGKRE